MRRAGLIVGETLRDLRSMVEPGVTTHELDAYAEKKIRAAGADADIQGLSRLSGVDLRLGQR